MTKRNVSMKTRVSFCIIVTLVCIACFAWSQERLTFSSHPEMSPMSWEHEGKVIGIAPEHTQLIFAELGITAESKAYPWARVLLMAKTGGLDVIANIWFTQERTDFLEYCRPHYSQVKTVVVVKKRSEFSFAKWEDLIGRLG